MQSDNSNSEARVIDGVIIPYQDEPLISYLTNEESSITSGGEEVTDINGLSPSILGSRYEEV